MLSLLALWMMLAAPPQDYFDHITAASEGRITRFETMPISVYVQSPPSAFVAYESTVATALKQWEDAAEGLLRFTRVDDPDADIRILWFLHPPHPQRQTRIAEANLVRIDADHFYVEIRVYLRRWPSLEAWDRRSVGQAMLHELGHAVGLWGHSPDPRDVLHYASQAEHLSERDRNTLRRLYATPVGTPRHAQALAALHEELEQDPNDARLHYLIGTVLMDAGDQDAAVVAFQKALELDPTVAEYAARLGMLLEKQGQLRRAIQQYERAIRRRPSPGLYGMLGTLYLMSEEFQQSVWNYQRAIRLNPGDEGLRRNLLAAYHRWGIYLLKQQQYESAARVLDEALKRYDTSPILHYDRGVAYEGAGKYTKAIAQYKKALSLDASLLAARRGLASVWNNLGAQQAKKLQWEKAIESFETALRWDPECWEANRNLEMTYLQQAWEAHAAGNVRAAIAKYQQILKRDPQSVEAHRNLGLVYLNQRRYPEAVDSLKRALALAPNSEALASDLRYARRQQWLAQLRGVFLPVLIVLALSYLIMKWTQRRLERLKR